MFLRTLFLGIFLLSNIHADDLSADDIAISGGSQSGSGTAQSPQQSQQSRNNRQTQIPNLEITTKAMISVLRNFESQMANKYPAREQTHGYTVFNKHFPQSIKLLPSSSSSDDEDNSQNNAAQNANMYSIYQIESKLMKSQGSASNSAKLLENLGSMLGQQTASGQDMEGMEVVQNQTYKARLGHLPPYPFQLIVKEKSEATTINKEETYMGRTDIEVDEANWEHRSTTMIQALEYVQKQILNKFPMYGAWKDNKFYTHPGAVIELIQNITPAGLNTPDSGSNGGSFYRGSSSNLIAVFLVKVKIYQASYSSPQQGNMQQQQAATQEPPDMKVLNRIYLVSFPKSPFTRSWAEGPNMWQFISQGVQQAMGQEAEAEESIPFQTLKAKFPTDKAIMKKIDSEEELAGILSNTGQSDSTSSSSSQSSQRENDSRSQR
jgi:hypothetical protein